MKTRFVLSLSLLVAGAAGCSGDFDPGARVNKLRVLAVRTDRPFARAGETVAVDTLVVDPAGRTLEFGFATCKNPRSSTALECFAAVDDTPLAIGNSSASNLVVPDVQSFGVVFAACPGKLTFTPKSTVPFRCDSGGRALALEEFEIGAKRIFLHAVDRNENPRIERITWDGADWPEGETRDASPCTHDANDFEECGEKLAHRIATITAAPETGVDEKGRAFAERLVVQYYASEGIFERDTRIASTPETRWVARRQTPAEVQFWFVARDDRGGVTWTQRSVRVPR